jgi:hypothetical protein
MGVYYRIVTIIDYHVTSTLPRISNAWGIVYTCRFGARPDHLQRHFICG